MSGDTGQREAWVQPLCLMVGTSVLLVAAYYLVQPVHEHVRMGNWPANDQVVTNSKYKAAFEVAGLTWTADLKAALAWARKNKRLIFLEIDGTTDINGALNHTLAFVDPAVQLELRRYVRVMLYTDSVPASWYNLSPAPETCQADAAANGRFQREQFNTVATPFYVILEPKEDGSFSVVASCDGIIRDVKGFGDFLRKPNRKAR